MFSHLKARVEPLRRPARRARLDRLRHRRAGRGAAVAACGPLEPRQEHLPDGADLEPRHDRLRVRGELRAAARRARVVGLGEAAYGTVGAALLATPLPAAHAQLGARRVLPRGHRWARCWASCSAASSPSAGAGRPASARSASRDCCSRFVFLADRARLQDGRAARRERKGGTHARSRRAPSSPRCCGRAPRSSRASAPASSS